MTTLTPSASATRTQPATASTVRVAVREIRENSWRALLAAGTSGGEATAAARAATWAEVHLGCGVTAAVRELTHELQRSAHPRTGVRHERHGSGVEVLLDPAGRGVLHLVPLAIGLVTAAAVPVPVHLPGAAWDPVLAGLLATTPGPVRPALLALHLDAAGRPDAGVHLSGAGEVSLLGDLALAEVAALNPSLHECAGEGAGLLLASDHSGLTVPHEVVTHAAATLSPEALAERWSGALADGVHVEAGSWHQLYAAASRFLVPEEEP
ncbi:MAG: hypothetical protein ACTHOD_04260 [Motilibacteraceae bacterium]